ncbi:MAG: aldo/keto reductase [Chthoniobacterales bacterium]
MNRRDFLRLLASAATVAPLLTTKASSDSLGAVLPQRRLGSGKISVTCLGLGGFHVGWTTEKLAQATIEAALEEGVRFFDTARAYGPHISEERYGQFLTPKYRDKIFLMSKSEAKDAATIRQHIEGSLRRLATDHIDLWQIHALESPSDVDARLAAGVLTEALKAQDEGKIRHIGFTGHANPYAHLRMLERTSTPENTSPFLTSQFPINPVDAASTHSFILQTLPEIKKAGLGVIAMKTLADGRFFASKHTLERKDWETPTPIVPDVLSLADCIHFALSLPISTLVTGAENPEFIREKAALVRSFHQMPPEQHQAIVNRVASFAEEGHVEYYKDKQIAATS